MQPDKYHYCASCRLAWRNGPAYRCPKCKRYLVTETTLAEARQQGLTFIDPDTQAELQARIHPKITETEKKYEAVP